MTDLDTLRPEVREALDGLSYFLTGTHNHHDFYTIRAELLRLAGVESELAALKARIAEAEVAELPKDFDTTHPMSAGIYITSGTASALIGKRVRLLVED